MKKVGYEVIARRPVCVDFADGRVISFKPGMRFKSIPSNPSVARLFRNRDLRKLGPQEVIQPLPPKYGAPRNVQAILQARASVAAAHKLAAAKLAASKDAPPQIEVAKPAPKKKN